ncbi:GNAT family N-acetyltransferase [Streptomyces antibioticus]|uniref:GNAT family N-acetyltransferase n=1 Tax=Streptomyces antibioticus TaxID=1890 RepID=UPI0033F8FA2D
MTPLPGDRFLSGAGSIVSQVSGPMADQGSGGGPLRIRAVTEDDLSHVVRLDAAAFPADPYPFFVLRQLLTAFPEFLLVVEDSAKDLRGYVLATPPYDAQSWILSLGITPELRRQGLGRELMTRILGLLRAKGTHAVWLSVEPGNDSAVALYRSLGFVPEPQGPRLDYFGPGEHRLLMSLAL